MNLSPFRRHLARITRHLGTLLDMKKCVASVSLPCGCCLGVCVLSWSWCVKGEVMRCLGGRRSHSLDEFCRHCRHLESGWGATLGLHHALYSTKHLF